MSDYSMERSSVLHQVECPDITVIRLPVRNIRVFEDAVDLIFMLPWRCPTMQDSFYHLEPYIMQSLTVLRTGDRLAYNYHKQKNAHFHYISSQELYVPYKYDLYQIKQVMYIPSRVRLSDRISSLNERLLTFCQSLTANIYLTSDGILIRDPTTTPFDIMKRYIEEDNVDCVHFTFDNRYLLMKPTNWIIPHVYCLEKYVTSFCDVQDSIIASWALHIVGSYQMPKMTMKCDNNMDVV